MRFVGEPVAAVVATDQYRAEDALDVIGVTYDPLPAVADAEASMRPGAPRLHDELPYASAVETEKWEERRDGSVKIDQVIYVQREGQKAIVLGKGGSTIKTIGGLAREELEKLFDRRVHLFLFVKVREGWGDDPERYRQMGLEFPKE